MKHLFKYIFLSGVLIIFLTSCKKLLEVEPPKNQLVTSTVFADSLDATSAVVGIYVNIMRGLSSPNFGNGAITVNTGFSSDEIYPVGGTANENELYANAITPNNGLIDWSFAYKIIYQATACIEGLFESKGLSLKLRNQLTGECKFMRALFYFNLINLYGDVPLVVSTNYQVNASIPRTSINIIYDQIMTDLIDAQNLLSPDYITQGRVRPNKSSATALLARVYLYQRQWNNAEILATQVISSASYTLEPNLNIVFLPNSKEILFQMIPLQPGFETAEGFKFIPASATVIPKSVITNFLLTSFESGDSRKLNWLKTNTVNGQVYYYPYKYKLGRDGNTIPLEYYTVLRLAEQYLIRAEARAQQNNLIGALSDLNVIRARAGLPNISANDQASVLTLIQHERQTELFCEWGHRWFDLKRTGTINTILGAEKPGWQQTDALYPIPQAELLANPFLIQNAGY